MLVQSFIGPRRVIDLARLTGEAQVLKPRRSTVTTHDREQPGLLYNA